MSNTQLYRSILAARKPSDFILPGRFVIRIKTDNAGASEDNQFTLTGAEVSSGSTFPVTYSPVSDPFNYTDVTLNVSDPTITVPVAGEYYVQYGSPLNRVRFNDGGDRRKVTSAPLQWGNIAWFSMFTAFYGCANMGDEKAKDVPDLSSVTNARDTFREALDFNQDIGAWDVSSVEDTRSMFQVATAFNQDIGEWDTSAVTVMQRMFRVATAFNQDIGNWDVRNVINMSEMFQSANAFNQSLENWELRLAGVGMSNMLNNCGLDVVNTSRTLIGFANYVHANSGSPSGVPLGASGLEYHDTEYPGIGSGHFTDAVSALDYLTNTANWTITGLTNVS